MKNIKKVDKGNEGNKGNPAPVWGWGIEDEKVMRPDPKSGQYFPYSPYPST